MDKKALVFARLKQKAKAFGFNSKELEKAAEGIASGLQIADDALEADVNALIDASVDAVIPILQISQSAAAVPLTTTRRSILL